MVSQKRLDYGFLGYQFPPTPRAARSARRRCSFKKKQEDNQVCAFDLLALVAGKLLLEKEPASSSDNSSANKGQHEVANNNSVKEEIKDEENPLKVEADDSESARGSFVIPDLISQVREQNHSPRESVYSEDDLNLGLASTVTSDLQEKSNASKLVSSASKNAVEMIGCKVEAGPSVNKKTSEFKIGFGMNRPTKDGHQKSRKVSNGAVVNTSSAQDPFGSDDHPKVLSCGKRLSPSLYPSIRGDVNLVSRDDDENSSGCTYPRTVKKHLKPAPRIGDRRIRKILASRYWKGAPRLKEATLANSDGIKPVYHNKKNYYKPQRSEKIYPFKKRKYFQYSSPSPSTSGGAISSEFVSDSARKGSDGDTSGCCPKLQQGTRASSSITAENTSFQPRDSHVKLRIKSFRVPELFIEIPESATVGSLKRSVMEAVSAILGGGLRVGVLLQGKKVRDDFKTLAQSGISHNNQLDSVGFSLEPNPSKVAPSLCPGVSPVLLPSDSPQPLSRYPPSPLAAHHGICTSPDPYVNNLNNVVESDHDSAPSPVDMSIDKSATDSKALVAVPAVNVEALAVVPAHRKSKRSEIVQRRIRRPFSVAEVEALVQAVEKLGTGRWRDVKLRAFDNAKHRTYVDLKDKWKTLVHTARISPQQRRGEPVPQELLDRVLTAHAYWSQHQAKQQQVKHLHQHPSQSETRLLLEGGPPRPRPLPLTGSSLVGRQRGGGNLF